MNLLTWRIGLTQKNPKKESSCAKSLVKLPGNKRLPNYGVNNQGAPGQTADWLQTLTGQQYCFILSQILIMPDLTMHNLMPCVTNWSTFELENKAYVIELHTQMDGQTDPFTCSFNLAQGEAREEVPEQNWE